MICYNSYLFLDLRNHHPSHSLWETAPDSKQLHCGQWSCFFAGTLNFSVAVVGKIASIQK